MKAGKNLISIILIVVFALTALLGVVLLRGEDLLLGAKPVAAVAEEVHHHTWSHDDAIPLTSVDGRLESSKKYYLTEDLTLTSSLTMGSSVDFCLNGHTITCNGKRVTAGSFSSLYDCSSNQTGEITGGGIYMNGGQFTMHGGKITGGGTSGQGYGGGVYVQYGSFTMYGGEISGNAASCGGGVYVASGRTFTMYGGTISDNSAPTGGGGVYVNGGTFNMNGGIISNNMATGSGGGSGGGVQVSNGTFNMNGGTITGNKALNSGGGVFVGDTFNVSGNVNITGNQITSGAANNVYLSSGKVINLTDNLNANARIGVTLASNYGAGAFTLGLSNNGTAGNFISDNSAYVVELNASGEAVLAEGPTPIHAHENDKFDQVLTADGGTLTAGNYYLEENVRLISNLTISGKVNLCLNGYMLRGNGNDSVITINSGATLNLYDCNGSHGSHTIVNPATGEWETIEGGMITGGNALAGGGVNLKSGSNSMAHFNMYGGTIFGNEARGNGGGVYVYVGSGMATFSMYGGTISGNRARESGGGVYLYNGGSSSSLIMSGDATICGNMADGSGGGVYAYKGTLRMQNNATISGNTARDNGGGVYMSGSCDMSDDAVISDNTARGNGGGIYVTGSDSFGVRGTVNITGNRLNDNTANNVYLASGKVITVIGVLSAEAKIGVTLENVTKVFTSGLTDKGTEENFISDNPDYRVEREHGEAVLVGVAPMHVHDDGVVFKPFIFSDDNLAAGNYYLTEDVNLSSSLTISATVNLCLNGHTLTGAGNVRIINIIGGRFNLYDEEGGKMTGGGIYLQSGTFTMYGGAISDNTTGTKDYGGGVNMKGGTFTMYGGEISGNTSLNSGGGVYVNGGTFNMNGGTISNNKATSTGTGSGGGVYVDGGTFNMSGGTITGNTARNYGGGVDVSGSGTFNVSGNVNITGNQKGGAVNNVYLSKGEVINVTGAIEPETKIGVTLSGTYGARAFTAGLSGKGSASNFISDDPGYNVVLENGEAKLAEGHGHIMTAHAATAATCTQSGNQLYYECTADGCDGKYFKDEAGNTPMNEGDWVLTATGHNWQYTAEGGTISATCAHEYHSTSVDGEKTLFVTVAWTATSVTYDGSAYTATVTGSLPGISNPSIAYTYSADNKTFSAVDEVKNAGYYKATITVTVEDKTYTATANFTIVKATVNVPAANTAVFIYNGTEQTYELAENALYTISNNTRTNAGSQDVTISLNDKINYEWAGSGSEDKTYAFTIARATAVITASGDSFEYDGKAHSITGAALNHSETTLSYSNNSLTDVGSVEVTISAAQTTNYEATSVTVTLTVTAREVAIVWCDDDFTYNGTVQKVTAYYLDVDNAQVALTVTLDGEFKNAGEYTATASFANNEKNYKLPDNVTNTYRIAKATVEVPTADDTQFVYNGNEQTYTLKASALYTVTGNTRTNAGSQDVKVSLNDKNNYEWVGGGTEDIIFNFTIEKATFDIASVSLGDIRVKEDEDFDIAITGILPEEVTVTYLIEGKAYNSEELEVGKYILTAQFDGGENYYAIPELTAVLTILRASATAGGITVESANGFDPDIQLSAGAVDGDASVILATSSGMIGANEQVLSVYDVTLLMNGESVQPDGELTITFQLPKGVEANGLKILHVHEGEVMELSYTVEGDHVTVTTDRLSEFVFLSTATAGVPTVLIWSMAGIGTAIVIVAVAAIVVVRRKRICRV